MFHTNRLNLRLHVRLAAASADTMCCGTIPDRGRKRPRKGCELVCSDDAEDDDCDDRAGAAAASEADRGT